MVVAQATGLALALASAGAWGGADFSGGFASRRTSPLEVLATSRLSALALLVTVAALVSDPLPAASSIGWAAAAGCSGALGLGGLYKGLSIDRAALVAPTAGVVGAALPVTFAAVVDGVLPLPQQLGLVTALVGIFLVSLGRDTSVAGGQRGLVMGILAGVGFGGFFVFMGQVEPGPVFTPVAVASGASLMVAVVVSAVLRDARRRPRLHPAAAAAGLLDAVGVVCYLLAIRWIRLDMAAVLGSLYPAVTVLLFRYVMRESVGRAQWIGLAVCVAAIALIAS